MQGRSLLVEAQNLAAAGRLRQAEALYRSALMADELLAEARSGLAAVIAASGRPQEALGEFERAITLSPDDAQLLNNFGAALTTLERTDEAIRAFEQAVQLDPDYAAAWHNLGLGLTAAGRSQEALRALERAVQLAPLRGEFHRSLALAAPFTVDDRRLAAAEAALRSPGLAGADLQELHFALGKAYGDLGKAAESLDHFLVGNAMVRSRLAYDEAGTLGQLARLEEVFTPELLARAPAGGQAGPVFIVGMPRSGTTLVEQMLAGHPSVHGAGERVDLPRIVAELGPAYPDAAPSLDEADWRAVGERYLAGVRPSAPGAGRITDKMPGNYRHLGLIALALPGAKVVHVRRGAADTCLSCFETLFRGAQPYSYDLAELGRYYLAYDRLMAHWRRSLPQGLMYELAYEDLVAEPEPVLRRLLTFLGLAWAPACLRPHETARSVTTASAVQVRRPIYGTSVGRWRAPGATLTPLLEALGIAT